MCWRHYTWYVECKVLECEPKLQDNYLCGPAEKKGITKETMEACPIEYIEGHSEYPGRCAVCKAKYLPLIRKRKLEEYSNGVVHKRNIFYWDLMRALASVESKSKDGGRT